METTFDHAVLSHLIRLLTADTFYFDLYLQRARFYLQPQLSLASYHALKKKRQQLSALPNQIRNAILRKDWHEVQALSALSGGIKDELIEFSELEEFARKIYDLHEVPIDPFSPGMHGLAGFTMAQLKELHQQTLKSLTDLAELDQEWHSFYQQRLAVFETLVIEDDALDSAAQFVPEVVLEEEAEQALDAGNMERLQRLAEKILDTQNHDSPTDPADFLDHKHKSPQDFSCRFPAQAIERAASFGLSHYAVPSNAEEYAPLARFAWHPTSFNLQEHDPHVQKVPDIPFDAGIPQALKARIQLFSIHPFINSSGVRYLPYAFAENVLVEDFAEPLEDSQLITGPLLDYLGLPGRNQLDRHMIETQLLARGNLFIEQELGLDPQQFKIVCIPADLHLRIGLEQGWGEQKIWTHFDGFMLMGDTGRKALVGGDVRYGGIYDLLGISCDYSSERIITRFAVVQRKRLAVWQGMA